jgi:aspartyl-tRNA(Asn)/glutamyl-tRNA(Gln) amidotransferase subunit A
MTVLANQGPLTRTVRDAALMLSVMSGPDLRDDTAWNTTPLDYRVGLDDGVAGLRVAWSPRLGYVDKIDADVEAASAKAAMRFAELGAIVEEVDPGFADPTDILRAIWYSVSSSVVSALPEAEQEKMDPGYRHIAELGETYTLGDYLAAHKQRAAFRNSSIAFHERYDLLLTPQMPVPAIEAGAVTPANGRFGDEWVAWSPYTYPFNLSQQPAASVPCGFTESGLPVGLQIVGPPRQDALVLRAARAYESLAPFATLSAPRQ